MCQCICQSTFQCEGFALTLTLETVLCLQADFSEMKAMVSEAASGGGMEINREIFDQFDQDISQAQALLKMDKQACERVETVMVALRQGIIGLESRVAPFKTLLGPDEHEAIDEEFGAAAGGVDPQSGKVRRDTREEMRERRERSRRRGGDERINTRVYYMKSV